MFMNFARDWNFEVCTRSPNYPSSNRLAEKGVGIAKSILKKSLEMGKDLFGALLEYRNSPLKNISFSPSQLLNSRRCKTKIPVSTALLYPEILDRKEINKRLVNRQLHNENYFNKSHRPLGVLEPRDNIVMRDHVNKLWKPARVVSETQG